MAKVMVICPSCQQGLEASEEDIGRDGQCSKCRNIFPIVGAGGMAAEAPKGWLAASRRYEYSDTGALASVIASGLCLILLVSASLVPWAMPESYAAGVVRMSRHVILLLSAVCAAYMAGTLILRASFVPAIATLSGWGMAVLMWQIGTWHMVSYLGKAEGIVLRGGIVGGKVLVGNFFLALLASVLVVGSGLFFYRQYHESGATRPIGGWIMGMHALGFVCGMAAVFVHVRPELLAAATG
jgi:hypothetical protein